MSTERETKEAYKERNWFLAKVEKRFLDWTIPRLPLWIETNHLTMMTFLWAFLIVGCGFLGQKNLLWVHGINVLILFQHITDMWDGTLGRYRGTGYVKWGFYMDHLLDGIFLSAWFLATYLYIPSSGKIYLILAFVLTCLFMFHCFLSFGASGLFNIAYYSIGPSELRYLVILLNILFLCLGVKVYVLGFSCFLVIGGGVFFYQVFLMQKNLLQKDKTLNI